MSVFQVSSLRDKYERTGQVFHAYHARMELARLCELKGAYNRADSYRQMANLSLYGSRKGVEQEWSRLSIIKKIRYRKTEWIEDTLFRSIYLAKLDVNKALEQLGT